MKNNYEIYGEGKVDVVIEMGLGACMAEWEPFCKEVSKNHCVLVYERFGIGKSEESDKERTPENIADELYVLLNNVLRKDKITLIGHSQGGLYAAYFATKHPELIEKLILVDPLSFKDNDFKNTLSENDYKKSGVDKSINFEIMRKLAKFKLGFVSQLAMKYAPSFCYYNFDKEQKESILDAYAKYSYANTSLMEYKSAHEEKNLELFHTDISWNFPVVIITHDSETAIKESMEFGRNTYEFADRIEKMWQNLMREYSRFSENIIEVRATRSGHYIHLTEPEIIIDKI